jgi:uncharacterized protein YprB with RNaseH-like and TPR domain
LAREQPLSGGDGRPAVQPAEAAGLAQALSGRCVADGLILSETRHVRGDGPGGPPAADGLPETCGIDRANWLYIDTETTGLSGGTGSLAFMVGVARHDLSGGLQLRQFTLGSFGAERDMLVELNESIGPDAVLVSYNGRCFDLPLLIARYRLHRLDQRLSDLHHLDLMYTVRRVYRNAWPDCRLQTAERYRLAHRRVDDLPGAEAPSAWQAWLRNRRADGLARVLAHNGQDVVSLAALHVALTADHANPRSDGADLLRVGLAWQAAGEPARAVCLWERHAARLGDAGQLALAAAYRRAGRWQEAESLWMTLFRKGSQEAACALSKYHEHRRRDYRRALTFARCCLEQDGGLRTSRLLRKLGDSAAAWNLELPLFTGACDRPQLSPLAAVSMK